MKNTANRDRWTSRATALSLTLLLALLSLGASRPASVDAAGMVVSPDERASRIGAAVLAHGGNAVDASVATAFALAVTYPAAGNLGGGGFMLVRLNDAEHIAFDFREKAPSGLTADLFLDEAGSPIPGLSLESGLAVGVPGTVRGLEEAHRRWGSLPWADLIRPAIALAREGFPVDAELARRLHNEKNARKLLAYPATRAVFAPRGRLLEKGETHVQPDLAKTLEALAEKGASAFYSGPVAEALVESVRRQGGVMSIEDLADYRPVARPALERSYRGYRVVTFPPPSSGGVAILQMLGMLEPYDWSEADYGSSLAVHRLTEVQRRAFADRARWLGDPEYFSIPQQELLDPTYLERRRGSIRDRKATSSAKIQAGEFTLVDSPDTLHFSIADRNGQAVALTTTLNTAFGTGIVAEGTGVLLNNEMDDFALAPGVPNVYGLIGGEANAVEPGKRPLSSMSPTIVEFEGGGARPMLVLGSPGGSRIISSVLQVIVGHIDFGMSLQEAVDAPRFHHQWLPDEILHEPRTFTLDVREALTRRGHALKDRGEFMGNVNAIGLDEQGRWVGAADPRRDGAAIGQGP